MKKFWREGEPFVWLTGAALSLTLLITGTLLVVIMVNGLGVFWPSEVAVATLKDGSKVMGEVMQEEPLPDQEETRLQFKIGNRDLYGLDFRWVNRQNMQKMTFPEEAMVLEREEYGNFYGFLEEVEAPGVGSEDSLQRAFDIAYQKSLEKKEVVEDTKETLAELSYSMEKMRLKSLDLQQETPGTSSPASEKLAQKRKDLRSEFDHVMMRQARAIEELDRYRAVFVDAGGTTKTMPLAQIVRPYRPNAMGLAEKIGFYAGKIKELLLGQPRESNTEGGLFPAIFGTVMLIFLMSLFSFPLGVIAAIYLREYAKDGPMVRIVRIAVNNLAGIPSIVYGIFGLGFFVYGIGAGIDQLFFSARLPEPTFGTGGILWASLTLALLTVPVVIVSTEEALGAIPGGVREGSQSLGATKLQTLVRVLLPMASPGIMTGLILAMARAAGEVAPLMITGVVKLAPALPLDGNFPYLHLDRKFMHLGFHIYDIGFQSPNVEAAKPMVFVTTLLLVLIVLLMSSVAIYLRERMKKKFTYGTF
ncbi:MAG: phosphate ABC transporter permease PstA [Desulfuromonadales bacterium]